MFFYLLEVVYRYGMSTKIRKILLFDFGFLWVWVFPTITWMLLGFSLHLDRFYVLCMQGYEHIWGYFVDWVVCFCSVRFLTLMVGVEMLFASNPRYVPNLHFLLWFYGFRWISDWGIANFFFFLCFFMFVRWLYWWVDDKWDPHIISNEIISIWCLSMSTYCYLLVELPEMLLTFC